ncbi:MAG TPA: HAMP domain-containing sensor histidine kinase [Prolixibacteraceae bacterium]|nr:HAMP domain-containing sensor histidine kinase [Prolixibacteraceae bacterium]
MKKRKFILGSLLLLTLVLIGIVRIVLKSEISEYQKERLDFFTYFIEEQNNKLLTSYHEIAAFANSTIENTPELCSLLAVINETPLHLEPEFKIQTKKLYQNLQQAGFNHLVFITANQDSINLQPLHLANHGICINSFETEIKRNLPDEGLKFYNNEWLYVFSYPYYSKNQFIGCIEIGFRAEKLMDSAYSATSINKPGLMFATQTSSSKTDSLAQKTQINRLRLEQCHICFNFDGSVFESKKIKHILNKKLEQSMQNKLQKGFSIYLNNNKNASALSFAPIKQYSNHHSQAYVVTNNYDYVLGKVKEINNAIFIINVFIIIFIMIGFSITIINRIKLIKEKREMQKSAIHLKEMNQSKDKFFSIIAHDLKNPFNGIMGLSGYLLSDYKNVDDQERQEIINDINIASKNAFNLLQNLLEWTRAQSGTIKNNPVPINPKHIIELALETVTNLAKNKDITLVEKYLATNKGFADENLIATVIRNLVTNAIKFSPRGSQVEITVNQHLDEVFFEVKDYGIGISHDDIDQLFRIDVNFHKQGTEKETGTGLGLKLCKEFVQYCGGRIWVISELGKGSSFYFTIPKSENQS